MKNILFRRSAMKSNIILLPLGIFFAFAATRSANADSTWAGSGAGNWSSTVSPGWTSGGVPNAAGAVAFEGIAGSNSVVTTQDIVAGVTVGTITKGGTANHSWTISGTNSLTLNQDGTGAGFATIKNVNANANSANNTLTITVNSLILADDLLILSQSGTNASQGNSISIQSAISGTGNVTLRNESSNNPFVGAIRITPSSASTFTGSVTVAKGAVVMAASSAFGSTSNLLTLGASGQGNATLMIQGNTTLSNNVVVAAGTGGTTLVTSHTNGSDPTISGTILLSGDLSVASYADSQVSLNGAISGTGNLTKLEAGEVRLAGLNTYTGNTIVSSGTLSLLDNAKLTFKIETDGVNNAILGTGVVNLEGDFAFDLSSAATTGSWTIVDLSTLTGGFASTFSVLGFTDAGNDTWTFDSGAAVYTFYETGANAGMLTASAVPEPSTWVLLGLSLGVGLILRRRAKLVG